MYYLDQFFALKHKSRSTPIGAPTHKVPLLLRSPAILLVFHDILYMTYTFLSIALQVNSAQNLQFYEFLNLVFRHLVELLE